MRDRLLTIDEVSEWLATPKQTIYGWRYKGIGPPAIRVGRTLRYRASDIERWLDDQTDRQERNTR